MEKKNFDCGFIVVTNQGRYGRNTDFQQAKNAAGLSKKQYEDRVAFSTTVFLFVANTPLEIKNNILLCYSVNDWGNVNQCSKLDETDLKQIDEYLLGWTFFTNEMQYDEYVKKEQKKARRKAGTKIA